MKIPLTYSSFKIIFSNWIYIGFYPKVWMKGAMFSWVRAPLSFFLKTTISKLCIHKMFGKTNISYPLVRTRTCVYQGIRNVSFSENFAYVRFNFFKRLQHFLKLGELLYFQNNFSKMDAIYCHVAQYLFFPVKTGGIFRSLILHYGLRTKISETSK